MNNIIGDDTGFIDNAQEKKGIKVQISTKKMTLTQIKIEICRIALIPIEFKASGLLDYCQSSHFYGDLKTVERD